MSQGATLWYSCGTLPGKGEGQCCKSPLQHKAINVEAYAVAVRSRPGWHLPKRGASARSNPTFDPLTESSSTLLHLCKALTLSFNLTRAKEKIERT
jgi:hypothetical protein